MRICTPLFIFCFSVITFSLSGQCPEGHSVSLPDGSTEAFYCDDEVEESISVRSDIKGYPKAYVLVDNTGQILWVSNSSNVPTVGLRPGTFQIYSFVYAGRLNDPVGELLDEATLTTFCWELSDNFIEVVISDVFIEPITFENGQKEMALCSGSSQTDTLNLLSQGHSGDLVIVAVDEDGIILQFFHSLSITTDLLVSGSISFYPVALKGEVTGQIGDFYHPDDVFSSCFSEAEPLVLSLDLPDGGELEFLSGDSQMWLCPNGVPSSEVEVVFNSESDLEYYLIVLNEVDEIILISDDPNMNLSGLNPGIYRIFGVSAGDNLLLTEVDTFEKQAAFEGDCFDWAENYLNLRLELPEGGSITFDGMSADTLFYCEGSPPDSVVLKKSGADYKGYVYVLSDADYVIRAMSETGVIYDIPDSGYWYITGLSYLGVLLLEEGDELGMTTPTDECYEYSENQLTIIGGRPEGGEINWSQPGDSLSFCSGDGIAEMMVPGHTSSSPIPYYFVLLDADSLVTLVFGGDGADLEGLEEGTYYLRGVSTPASNWLVPGEKVDVDKADCYEFSSNELVISAVQIDGGEVFFRAGRQTAEVCERPNEDFRIRIFRNSFSPEYLSVITDEENRFIARAVNDSINVRGLTRGAYRIWGIGHQSDLSFTEGVSIFDTTLSVECYSISEDFITLFIDEPYGGDIRVEGSSKSLSFCVTDVPDEWLQLESSSHSLLNFAYVVIDNGFRVVEVLTGDSIHFGHYDAGVYRIAGLSYGGNLLLQTGDLVIGSPHLVATDCFKYGNNVVQFALFETEGGLLSFPDGSQSAFACPVSGSGVNDYEVQGEIGDGYVFMISDINGMVLDYTEDLQHDFSEYEEGVYWIDGAAYTGQLQIEIGVSVGDQQVSDGCFALSENQLQIIVDQPDGGEVMTIDGLTEVVIDIPTQAPYTLVFDHHTTSMVEYSYILTDGNGSFFGVIPQDFLVISAAFLPRMRIYGLSYTGNVVISSGENIETAEITDGCFDLSSNFIDVTLIDGITSKAETRTFDENMTGTMEVHLSAANPIANNLEFVIKWNSEDGIHHGRYSLYNVEGKMLFDRNFSTRGNRADFSESVRHLAPGSYFLRIESAGDFRTIQLIKH